ncbi:MAG: hypothetical protein R6X29_04890 [Acidimicrobiia bacterium]|jgi:hypothetical protein
MPIHRAPPGFRRTVRHEHMLRRFSRDFGLLLELDHVVVADPTTICWIVEETSADLRLPPPELRVRANRAVHTGLYEPGSPGRLRIGAVTTAGVIAHELGHHLVAHAAPPSTPGHGKVWVAAYDRAAERVAGRPEIAPHLRRP